MKPLKVEKFKIDPRAKDSQKQNAFVAVSCVGCPVEGCNCSPQNYISMSDGKIGLVATLNLKDIRSLMEDLDVNGIWEKNSKSKNKQGVKNKWKHNKNCYRKGR